MAGIQEKFVLNGITVAPGQRATIDLGVARLYTHSEVTMPVHVVHGKKPGAHLFVSAAIHGDEINGVEIIRRLLRLPALDRLRGVLIAVPVVNVHGFIHHSRYLPDRRDLNRNFPGSPKGSLTARLANLFMQEIVKKAGYGIDLHTGAVHRSNIPQIRANLDDAQTKRLAEAFHVPVLLNAAIKDGSLRQVAADAGIPMLVYEAGEALRFDELSIQAGVKGVIGVMRELGMLPARKSRQPKKVAPVVARSSLWVRAPESGILRISQPLGARVHKGDALGVIADPFGEREVVISAPHSGVIIGRVNLPLANEGDALFHVARFEKPGTVAAIMEEFHSGLQEPQPETFEVPPPE